MHAQILYINFRGLFDYSKDMQYLREVRRPVSILKRSTYNLVQFIWRFVTANWNVVTRLGEHAIQCRFLVCQFLLATWAKNTICNALVKNHKITIKNCYTGDFCTVIFLNLVLKSRFQVRCTKLTTNRRPENRKWNNLFEILKLKVANYYNTIIK